MKLEIIFIPTAGGVTIPFRHRKELPWWLQIPPFKKWVRNLSGVHVYQPPILKLETIARCEKGASLLRRDNGGVTRVVFLSGGASKRKPSNVELMEREFHRRGASPDKIFLDPYPVQTTEKTEDLAKLIVCLSKELGKDVEISVAAVVSWYYCFRIRWEIRRWMKKHEISVPVRCFKIFPPLTWECLKREYLYNIFSEPFKIFFTLFPNLLKQFGKNERKTRGIKPV